MYLLAVTPYIYIIVVHKVYNQDRSPEVDDVEGWAAAATKHLELLKQKDRAQGSFIIEKILGKLMKRRTYSFSDTLEDLILAYYLNISMCII
jgi:hypothetical protein